MDRDIKILYVEDELSIQEFVKIIFKRNNIQDIEYTFNGKEALEIYKKNHYDIVITDMIMPEIDGFELIEKIRKINPEQIIIMVTGLEGKNDFIRAIELGVNHFISKPINPKKFIKVVKESISLAFQKRALTYSNLLLEQYKQAIDASAILSITDTSGVINYVNDAFCDTTKYSREELIGKTHRILRHPDTKEETLKDLWNTIKNNNKWKGIIKNKTKNGTTYIIENTIIPISNIEGEITEYIAISYNISELEEHKLELQKLNENLEDKVKIEVQRNKEKDHMLYNQSKNAQMGEMISMIAHQWRQPLNALSASAVALSLKQSMNMLEDQEIKDHTIFVEEQTQKMSKIINDFMNFFKPDEATSRFTLNDLIEDINSLIGTQLKNRSITLNCINGCNITMVSYQKELEHVLINLIANARDAFEENPQEEAYINVGYTTHAEKGIIFVEDNAGGIPEDIVNKIFNPYFTTKEEGKGTGIGLHMTNRIVKEILKGSIEVGNTQNGAKFTITLPLDFESSE